MSNECKLYSFDEYERVEIWCMADLHIGHESFDLNTFKKYIDWTLEKPNRFIIGLGDYIENVSSGRFPAGMAFKSQVFGPTKQRDLFIKLMFPVRDRILCLIQGNHDGRTDEVSQIDAMELIIEKLGCDYLGKASRQAWINLWFSKYKNYKVFLRHGVYGGMYPRNHMRNMIKDYGEVADLILIGHGHQLKPTYELKNRYARGKVYKKRIPALMCGSFLKDVSYAKSKGMLDTEMGNPILQIDRERIGYCMGLDYYRNFEEGF